MLNRNGTQVEDRGYDPGGRLTSVDRAFTDETRSYDAANRLTSISNTGVGQTTYSWDANGNKLGETWDGSRGKRGRGSFVQSTRRAVPANDPRPLFPPFTTQKSGASQFIDGYDAEDRFRRFIRSGQNEDRYFDRSMIGNIFDIDTNGNHTPRTFGLAHELTVIAADPQSFDAKGNVTQIPGSLRGMTSDILLSWDFDNRLKSSTADSTTTDCGYDAMGRRVSKRSVVFVYGGAGQQNCIAEYASGAAPTSPDREFVYGDSIDSLVLISDRNDTRRLLATRNQQWSVVALVDLSDGSVVERYTYDVFGARRVLDASGAEIAGSGQYGMAPSQYGNPYGYTSRRHDLESGLMYFRARFYDPTTGEFLSRDPLGYVDGMSLYRGYYVPGSTDPTGMFQEGAHYRCPSQRAYMEKKKQTNCPPKKCVVTKGPRFYNVGPLEVHQGVKFKHFRFEASFSSTEGRCSCCELRLKIMWDQDAHKAGGELGPNTPPHSGFTPPDNKPNKWHEDRNRVGSRYGHRGNNAAANDRYTTWLNRNDQKSGCYYDGYDTPMGFTAGKFLFKLEVVDICAKGDPPVVAISSGVVVIDWSQPGVPYGQGNRPTFHGPIVR